MRSLTIGISLGWIGLQVEAGVPQLTSTIKRALRRHFNQQQLSQRESQLASKLRANSLGKV